MIRADALTRTYGEVVAVNNVSFEIGPKEIVGLLGHNGAGKTTIMKMMTGYLEPSAGNVSINGHDVWSEHSMIQQQIGYLPENCPLYPEMTVLDYLDYAAALRSVPEEKRLDRIGYVIQKTNLAAVADNFVNTLSRGYRQRLGVAQAILNSPSTLILDEPTNGLDPSQIVEMRSLIRELAETATIVISTHILQEVQAVCSRVIIINSGTLALDAAMSTLQTTSKLRFVTDREPEPCARILEKIQGVRIVHSEKRGEHYHYIVASESQDLQKTTPAIARLMVEQGCNVYALHPLTQDLETIFAEISAGNLSSAGVGNNNALGNGVEQLKDNAKDSNKHHEVTAGQQQDGESNE